MSAVNRVQKRKQALAGFMRIAPEGTRGAWQVFCVVPLIKQINWFFRPGDNPSQCAQGYNCPPPTVSLESFSVFPNRFVDVGAGGPSSFDFEVSSNVSWVETSPSSGSISSTNPEERVFFNVRDWSNLKNGVNTARITFTGKATGQPSMSVTVLLSATKTSVSGDFHGMSKAFFSVYMTFLIVTQRLC